MTQPNPNIMHNTTHNNNVEAQTSEVVPAEIAQLLESNSSTLDSDGANLVQQILPGMVDDDNQPLPENVPTPAKEGQDAPQLFSTWELQAQGMPELQHRREANNPTTVRYVFLQAICFWDHHPSNQHMLERRETSSCQLWRVPSLAWFVVHHGNNQWSRTHGFLVNG